MFKKPFKISQKHNQAGKDRKKFKAILEQQFNKESIANMFSDIKNLIISKIEKSKVTIISDEEDPLIVDTTSKGDYFPTIYLLNLYPNMVNIMFVLKPGVEHFVYKGANLMWPGVGYVTSVESFHSEELVAIVTSQGFICAIGATSCDQKEYDVNKGKEGIAAFILHYYGDELFNWGSKKVKVKTKKESIDLHDLKDDTIEEKPQIDIDYENNINNDNTIYDPSKNTLNSEQTNKDTIPNDNKNEYESIKIETNDAEILEAFFNALKLTIKDDLLPLENSYFWNRFIVPCKSLDTNIDIKLSSFKKLGKFYQEMDKQGYIKYEEASKRLAAPHVIKINWQNPVIKSWKPTIKEPATIQEQKDNSKSIREKISQIDNLIKPQPKIKKYLSQEINDYIQYDKFVKVLAEGLSNLGLMKNSNVVINDEIKKILNIETKNDEDNQNQNKSSDEKEKQEQVKITLKNETMTYKAFLKKVEGLIIYRHQIKLPDSDKIIAKPGKFKGVLISAEKIQNKFITKVFNLPEYGIKLEPLLTEWQVKYGTSGTIHVGNTNKDLERIISLQGIFIDELRDFLISEYKIAKSMIETVNKTGKTKKKK